MTTNGLLQIGLYFVVLLALARPLGAYMARVYEGKPFGLDRILGPFERLIYRLTGVRADEEMDWKVYALSMLLFSGRGRPLPLRAATPARAAALESPVAAGGDSGLLVQHRHELRDQYQLAGLRR